MTKEFLTRRDVMVISAAAGFSSLTPGRDDEIAELRIGAIRWDAWEATGSANLNAVEATLGPREFHYRAPFCAKESGADEIELRRCDSQNVMDREIVLAQKGGLNYWAYCWFELSNPMMNAWHAHQASKIRTQLKWCMILPISHMRDGKIFDKRPEFYLDLLLQENYEHVASGRPLVYLYMDTPQARNFSWAEATSVLRSLRDSCARISAPLPFFVMMHGNVATAISTLSSSTADAIGSYIGPIPPGKSTPYAALAVSTEQYWIEQKKLGIQIIPTCMTGWDPRPRAQNPPPWQKVKGDPNNEPDFVEAGSPSQIAAHVAAGLHFVQSNKKICLAQTMLIYSWNECDEGGSSLLPTYTSTGPNTLILDAVGRALRAAAM